MSASLAPIAGVATFTFTPLPDVFDYDAGSLAPGDENESGPASYPAVLFVGPYVEPGDEIPTFGSDFFERIHYSFKLQELGNLIGQQTFVLYVWQAFRRAEFLNAINATNAEGIELNGGPPLPASVPPLRELAYTIIVGTDGPPTIDATFAFDWQTLDDSVRITGSRITAWSFVPDWSNGVLERLEWRTDVLQAYNATEQRRALRLAPRKAYEFEVFFTGRERRYAEAATWGWGARAWALPIWPDGSDLAVQANAGATEIMVDTATRDYDADSLAVLIRDALTFEVVEVQTVLADRLVLKRTLENTWPVGTRIWPARVARLQQQVRLSRFTGDASGMRVSFDIDEPVDYTADAGGTLHRGYPVLTRAPNWSGGLDLELARKLAELDNQIGPRNYEDEAGMPIPVQRMRWTWVSRAEVDAYRKLLYALRGRHGAAWVPTWQLDLLPVATIAAAALAIDVEFLAYTTQIQTGVGRRDIRIELTSGQVFYRRISNAQQLDAATERLTIDAPLGINVTPAQVSAISFMTLMRLDSDALEIAHWTDDVADAAAVWRGFNSDV